MVIVISMKNMHFVPTSSSLCLHLCFLLCHWISWTTTGYACEELSEVSPDHQFLAYTMYDKENDHFVLSVRNLATGLLCDMPQISNVANLAWAMDGQTLLYTITDSNKRPFRLVVISSLLHVICMEEFSSSTSNPPTPPSSFFPTPASLFLFGWLIKK